MFPKWTPLAFQMHAKWPHNAITREFIPGDNIKCSIMGALGSKMDTFRGHGIDFPDHMREIVKSPVRL